MSRYDDKSAYAQTIFGLCAGPGQVVHTFGATYLLSQRFVGPLMTGATMLWRADGRTPGKIVPARGPLDFGWDPVFEPDEGGGKTYAEQVRQSSCHFMARNGLNMSHSCPSLVATQLRLYLSASLSA